MALIGYQDKDNTQPTSDPRRKVTDGDLNEIKAVVNANAAAMATAASFVFGEVPTGTINGSNTAFTLANTPVAGSLQLYSDGIRVIGGGVDYTLSGTSITMVTPPSSALIADYRI